MSQNKDENTTQSTPAQQPQAKTAPSAVEVSVPDANAQDVFSSEVMVNSDEEELFAGDLSFLKDLTRKSVSESAGTKGKSNSVTRSIFAVFIANMFLMLVLVGVVSIQSNKTVIFRVFEPSSKKVQPSEKATKDVLASQQAPEPSQSKPVAESASGDLAEVMEGAVWSQEDQEIFKRGVSLKTADELFSAGRYVEACYVYDQIGQNWVSAGTNGELMRDFLKLRMAICMHRAGQPAAGEECFTHALQSRAAYVRGMAFYYLARIHFQNRKYLEARQNAYQAIALYKAFEEMLATNLEADLYFLIADSLTREVVGFYNLENELPGRDWSDSLMDIWPTEPDALRLEEALLRTAQRLAEGAVEPRLTMDANRPVGSQWSLICLQSPLEETLWKLVSQANLKAAWEDNSQSLKDRPVSVYMTYVPVQYIAETICGSKGLIWQYDGQSVSILNPSSYADFETHRSRLIQETISVWQRFRLRYRDDNRIANVHYSLGRMYTFAGQSAAALGEFKLLQGRFSQNALAPYTYLEASKIKVDMKDYEGAGTDLKEMLLQYPDCPVIDQATLYLARTAFESGQTERARVLFEKSQQMNLSQASQFESMLGLGHCAYVQKDWNEAKTWLSKALELADDKNDSRIGPACFMLGRAYIKLSQYGDAAGVLRIALNSKLSEKEYIQTILELVDAECRQQNFLEAMNILDQVPQDRFSQEESCNLLIAKARILRDIGVAESAISLLRKKIEFVSDSRLRARLTLELVECYILTKDYSLARRELNNVLADMPDSYHTRRASLILAQVIEKLGQPSRAEELCLAVLTDPQAEENIRNEAFNTLGRIYAGQKYYEKAALAFAGILPQGADIP